MKGTNMTEARDNRNRIALWTPKDQRRTGYYKGYGDFNGIKVYDAVMIVEESDRPNSPFATLWWRHADSPQGQGYCTPIWNNDGKLGGKIDGWWLNVWKNDTGPALSVTFKAMEDQRRPAETQPAARQDPPGVPDMPDDNDIPF